MSVGIEAWSGDLRRATRALLRPLLAALALASVLTGVAPAAVQDPTVTARLGQGVLKLGDATSITITVNNSLEAQLGSLPEVSGLRIGPASGPSVVRSRSIIGGRISTVSQATYTVSVEALGEGDFEIPPIDVFVGSQRLQTPALALTVRTDLQGAELGFIELRGLSDRIVEGQPIEVELVFGWSRQLAEAINYADLRLPWWDGVPGALIEQLPRRGALREVEWVLNRRTRIATGQLSDETVDGQPFVTFRVRLELLPVRAGRLEFPGTFLQFGTVERRGFFGDAQLVRDYFAKAPDFAVEVEALPTANQPFDYTGAIGRVEARASADTRDVRAGDSIKLTVEWYGSGNLSYFEPPDPSRQPGFEGFRFFGSTGEKLAGRRRVVYDLAPIDAGVTEIPALELPVFDTELWEYTRVRTEPIPIRVRALEGEGLDGEAPTRFAEDLRDIVADPIATGGAETGAPGLRTLAGALGGMLLSWLALRSAVRQGGRDPSSVDERRRRRALRLFERELRTSLDPETDLRAWAGFLAARTGDDVEAWLGRDPDEVFGAGGDRSLSPDSIDAIRRTGAALESAVFGDSDRVPRADLIANARDLLGDGL